MFAFGMMLYELFAKRLITFDMIKKGVWQDSAKFIHVAAQQVADGFRPDFPPNFPSEIRPLVESCWSEVGVLFFKSSTLQPTTLGRTQKSV